MTLRQRKLFTVKEFELKESSLRVYRKNLAHFIEFELPYEEIFIKKRIRQSKKDVLILVVSVFFWLAFIASSIGRLIGKDNADLGVIFVFGAFALLSTILTFLNAKRLVLIPTANNGYLEFFFDRPSRYDFDNFMNRFSEKANRYFRVKYGSIDLDLPKDTQLTNLIWLKEQEVISSEEFENLKNKLLGRKENAIGYRP